MQENGKITVSKTTSTTDSEGWVSIELLDQAAGIRVQVKLTLKNFARVVTGQGRIPCEMRTLQKPAT